MSGQEARSAASVHTDSTDPHTCGDRGSAARSGKASVTEPLDLARLWLIALPPKKGSKK